MSDKTQYHLSHTSLVSVVLLKSHAVIMGACVLSPEHTEKLLVMLYLESLLIATSCIQTFKTYPAPVPGGAISEHLNAVKVSHRLHNSPHNSRDFSQMLRL